MKIKFNKNVKYTFRYIERFFCRKFNNTVNPKIAKIIFDGKDYYMNNELVGLIMREIWDNVAEIRITFTDHLKEKYENKI